uniref:EpsG family protein n=2 Tax=Flavobacterium sp. TaxID=239 RepID=UPI00404AEE55
MHQNQNKLFIVLMFFITPITALYVSLKNLDNRGKHFALTFFGFWFGLLLNYEEGNDAAVYVRHVTDYYVYNFQDIIDMAVGILTFNPLINSPNDLYVHILFSIAGSIFQQKTLLFGLVGLVYGYFYGRALLKIIKIPKNTSTGLLVFSLILLFVIHRSFDSMQTVRSWTGMWVLFNGVYSYAETKKRKYILLILCTPLFHLMYTFIAIPALIFIILNKILPSKVIIGIFFFSFISNINIIAITEASSENDLAQSKLSSYYRIDKTGEGIDPIAQRLENSGGVWYAKYGKSTVVYFGAVFFIFFLIFAGYYSKIKMTDVEYSLASTGLLLASLANFLSFAYTLYSRTMANATIYILAVMVLLALRNSFTDSNSKFAKIKRFFVWSGVVIYIPKIVYFTSTIFLTTSFLTILFPFTILFSSDLNFSIRDFINFFII